MSWQLQSINYLIDLLHFAVLLLLLLNLLEIDVL
jgi:hypothetical protein